MDATALSRNRFAHAASPMADADGRHWVVIPHCPRCAWGKLGGGPPILGYATVSMEETTDCQSNVHCGLHKSSAPCRPDELTVERGLRARAIPKGFALDAVPVVDASHFADDNTLGGHFRFGANGARVVGRSAVLDRTRGAFFRHPRHRIATRATD